MKFLTRSSGHFSRAIALSLFCLAFVLLANSVHAQLYTYSFTQSTGQSYSPLTNATASSATGDDDAEFGIMLPFTFRFNGNDYSEIGVGTNGWVRMGSSTLISNNLASENFSFGSKEADPNFIFPLWDNLNPSGGSLSYGTYGSTPNRAFIIEWKDVHWSSFGSDSSPTVSFQVWLYESSNRIEFRYGQMNNGLFPSASIGMTGSSGLDFISVTPGNPALISTTVANNEIADASLLSNSVFAFDPAQMCSGLPLADSVISSTSQVCNASGTSVDFSLGGANILDGLTYQWEQSPDGQNWSDATIASTTPFFSSPLISSTTQFRCKITCATTADFLYSSNFLLQESIQACYCNSTAAGSADFDTDDIGRVSFSTLNNGNPEPVTNNPEAINQRSEFYDIAPTVLTKGATYPISINQISSTDYFNNGHINVFIDYNQNGIYEDEERVYHGETFKSLNIASVTGSVTIPAYAITGITGMRIILVTSLTGMPQEAPCDQYSFGETEDYLVHITDPPVCSDTPSGGTAVASKSYTCDQSGNESSVTLSLTSVTLASGLNYVWQVSNDGTTWTDIVGATQSSYETPTITSSVFYRCKVTCSASGLSSYSTNAQITYSYLGCYCQSSPYDPEETADIGKVEFGTFSNGVNVPALGNASANKSYSDFTSLTPIDVYLGASYPITVSQIESTDEFYSNYVSVYIDFNQDAVFDESEKLLNAPTFSLEKNFVTSSVAIPWNAKLGLTRMRVIMYYLDGIYSACDSYSSGETEDYLINVVAPPDCQGLPTAGVAVTTNAFLCNNTPAFTTISLLGSSASSGLSYQWQQSSNGSSWSDVSGENNISLSAEISAATFFRCRVLCTASSQFAYSDPVKVSYSFLGCYCSSAATEFTDQDIGNVTFGSFTNGDASVSMNNPYSNNTYSDFRSLAPIQVQIGIPTSISVTQIEQRDIGSFYVSYINVYIDYNHDGVYDPSSETAFSGSTGLFNNITQGFVTVPADALTGITGMRVSLQDGATRASGYLPCGDYDWGETEDYLVNILPPSPCTGVPAAGNATALSSVLCDSGGMSTTVSLSNFVLATGLSVQWQESIDDRSWGQASGTASDLTYVAAPTNSLNYYRAKLTCNSSGLTSYSTSAKVVVSKTGCSCQSVASDGDFSDIGNVTITGILNNGVIPQTEVGTQFNLSATNTYSDFTSLPPVTLQVGKSYPIQVTQMDRYYFNGATISVYIDLNHNGVFDLPNELVLRAQTTDLNTPFISGEFTIPADSKSGFSRLRIVLEDDYFDPNGNLNSPCGTYVDGETEDYMLFIQGVTAVDPTTNLMVIYPNPTASDVTVNFREGDHSSIEIKIIDIKGQIVKQGNYQLDPQMNAQIGIRDLPNGTYMVNILSGGSSYTRKIIVAK